MIPYDLPRGGEVRVGVYDVSGRAVRTLVRGVEAAGTHRVAWDGRDDRGRVVGSGMYFVRLEFNGLTETRKVAFLK